MLIALLVVVVPGALEGKQLRGSNSRDASLGTNTLTASLVKYESVQPSGATTVSVKYESFFSRMSDAFGQLVLGFILIALSMPVLWFNEKRNAQYETLISRGEQQCREVTDGECDAKNSDWLVHAVGNTSSVMPVEDELFNVSFKTGAIKLGRCVEIYQWVQHTHEKKHTKETLGGGKETITITEYTYEKTWRSSYDDGADFKEPAGHENKVPVGMQSMSGFGGAACELVEFGNDFILSETELGQLGGGVVLNPGDNGFPEPLRCKNNTKLKFIDGKDGYHYSRDIGTADMERPEIGDVRVQFHVLKDCAITVVGLQSEGSSQQKAGFKPFRVVRRPICSCGFSEEDEKQLLRKEVEKTPEEYANEAVCGGCLGWCFCCPCNLVAMCTAALRPELHHAYLGTLSKTECFSRIKTSAAAQKWMIRLLGWVVMFIGLNCLFAPFTTFLKLFPFGVGTLLSSVGGAITGAFSFIVTLIAAMLIISLAYLVYHPCLGALSLICLAGVIVGIIAINNTMVKSHVL